MTKIILGLLLLLPSFAFSATKLKVKFDCVLDRNEELNILDQIGCVDLKMSYFKNKQIIEDAAKPDFDLIIRSTPLSNFVEYNVTLNFMNQGKIPLALKLNSTLSSAELMEHLLTFLDQVTAPYITIINAGSSGPQEPGQEKPEAFYGSASLEGYGGKQQGVTTINSSGKVIGNYSTEKWRVFTLGSAGFMMNKSETTEFTPGINSKINYLKTEAGGIRDVGGIAKGRWDVAVFISHNSVTNDIDIDSDEVDLPANAQHNNAKKTVITAGTEWILVPFLTTTTPGNISIRYKFGVEHHKYVSPETFENVEELFAKHTLQVYLAKHYEKVDFKVSAAAFASSFRQQQIKGLSGGAEVSFKINSNMTVGGFASLTYAKNRVMSPADGSMSFLGLTSGQTPLTYQGGLTFTYNLGGIRIFNRDQRWKD